MKKTDALLLVFFVICAGIAVTFGLPDLIPYSDRTIGGLVEDTVPRFAVSLFLIVLMVTKGYTEVFKPQWRGIHLLWGIPCFLVAIVNFPFSALIRGAAVIERVDLLWLFVLKCIAIALLEEIFFRALLLPLFMDRFAKNRYFVFISVLGSSVLFALMHLFNLFFGAGVGETMLQVGYTFLIGCMLAVMMLRTENIWLCVIVHAVFDVGGTIVTDLGNGPFQDMTFWILTIVAGLLCAVHILLSLKRIVAESKADKS